MKKTVVIVILLLIALTGILVSCKKATTVEFMVDNTSCNGCGRCVQACPFNAIELNEQGKAVIDQTLCQQCGTCVRVCPQNAIF